MPQRRLNRNTITYSAATSTCSKAGQWHLDFLLLCNRPEQRLQPNTFTCSAAVRAREEAGRWARAMQLVRYFPDRRLRPGSFFTVVKHAAEGLAHRRAERLARPACADQIGEGLRGPGARGG